MQEGVARVLRRASPGGQGDAGIALPPIGERVVDVVGRPAAAGEQGGEKLVAGVNLTEVPDDLRD